MLCYWCSAYFTLISFWCWCQCPSDVGATRFLDFLACPGQYVHWIWNTVAVTWIVCWASSDLMSKHPPPSMSSRVSEKKMLPVWFFIQLFRCETAERCIRYVSEPLLRNSSPPMGVTGLVILMNSLWTNSDAGQEAKEAVEDRFSLQWRNECSPHL